MELIEDGTGTLQLRGELHISEAEALRILLLEAAQAANSLSLDLSGVESCDAASLQVLCALRQRAVREGAQLRVASPSAAMSELCATLGFPLEQLGHEPDSSSPTQ